MSGQGGQHVFIIPTHDLVIVRMGHQSEQFAYKGGLNEVLSLITAAGEK